ncbi:MAG: hypothetical protein AAGI11_22860 [Pseudomonadota bacterium]
MLIGLGSLAVRLLFGTGLGHSALLYVLGPYLLAIAIAVLRPIRPKSQWWQAYVDFSLVSLIVLLATSILLGEGFICVLFFLPIHFSIVTLVFIVHGVREAVTWRRNRHLSFVLPLVVTLASVEGTSPMTSFERAHSVEVSKVAPHGVAQLHFHLGQPIDLRRDRHWLLAPFPMPEPLDSQIFEPGAVHELNVRYPRWFVTNVHAGDLRLLLTEVSERAVKAQVVHDTTLFATYLALVGIELQFEPMSGQRTQVTLRVDYERRLDPAWYFHPLIGFALTKMGEFLIDEVIIREQ